MCTNKTSSPDTSAQEAEAARQRQGEQALAEERLRQERELYEQQRADAERRYQEQLALQNAENQRQRDIVMAEIARREAAERAAEAQRQAEREAQTTAAAERAAQARAYADQRNTFISDATSQVNQAYAGFDDAYFNKFAQDFADYYKPRVRREFGAANNQTTYGFSDAGTLRSSMAAQSFGDLARERAEKEAGIAGEAQDRAQGFRSDIEAQRGEALRSIYDAGSIAPPSFEDGLDGRAAAGAIGTQLSNIVRKSTDRASSTRAPSVATNPINLSFANAMRTPNMRRVA
jgi:murein L,D-transpeptidase YcbB/YkuD